MLTVYICGNVENIEAIYHIIIINQQSKQYMDYYDDSQDCTMLNNLLALFKVANIKYKAVHKNDMNESSIILEELENLNYVKINAH